MAIGKKIKFDLTYLALQCFVINHIQKINMKNKKGLFPRTTD